MTIARSLIVRLAAFGIITLLLLGHAPAATDKIGRRQPEPPPEPAAVTNAVGREWKNPETHTVVILPAEWVPGDDQSFPVFDHAIDHRMAALICDEVPKTVKTVGDYAAYIAPSLAEFYRLGDFESTDDPDIMLASGTAVSDNVPSTVLLGKSGQRFCSISYSFLHENSRTRADDPALTAALFASLEETQVSSILRWLNSEVEWTNPETGATVFVPDDWHDRPGEVPALEDASGSRRAALLCNPVPESVKTLEDFSAFLAPMIADDYSLAAFATTDEPNIRIASGTSKGVPVTLVIGKVGDDYCTIYYNHIGQSRSEQLDDPALTAALFASAADRPLVAQQPGSPQWTVPGSDITITLANGWTHTGTVGGVEKFHNADQAINALYYCKHDESPTFEIALHEFGVSWWIRQSTQESIAPSSVRIDGLIDDIGVSGVVVSFQGLSCAVLYIGAKGDFAHDISDPALSDALLEHLLKMPLATIRYQKLSRYLGA